MNKLLEKQLKGEGCNFDSLPQELAKWQKLLISISDTYDADERSPNERRTDSSSSEILELKEQLLGAEKLASMAEVASSVLHNVGNIVNSINVSLALINENFQAMHIKKFFSAIDLMKQHKDEINYLIEDPKGKLLPGFLIALSEKIKEENELFAKEIAGLNSHIQHVRELINMQQTHFKPTGLVGQVFLPEIADGALQMCGNLRTNPNIHVDRIYEEIPFLSVDKSKLLQILVNLIQNAKDAVSQDLNNLEKRIKVYIKKGNNDKEVKVIVSDNGIGIDPNDIEKIFLFGFTKKANGHGIGLHTSILNAKDIGGKLTVNSEGVGQGATFTLTLPLAPVKLGGQVNG